MYLVDQGEIHRGRVPVIRLDQVDMFERHGKEMQQDRVQPKECRQIEDQC